ncbi:YheC/YheD family protein [Bacillus sp. FJAT-42376]|uniref:YheC/YheD family endospore coat-associated protein n=1 Tax=Bacillus sp. FJAT-42376 TaxID=2014076 RepID=UPI000F4D7E6E|nr:YheC/YheD family protein [Bacillus sp. FJAT-42376]AZB42193.1 YheC/YheD family protein [Bacillus sp. FJAT-42376]
MKMTLGFMTLHQEAEKAYSTEIAKRSGAYGLTLFRFCPADIQPGTALVKGFVYENETWTPSLQPIPAYIYDRCFYSKGDRSSKSRPIAEWLKNRPDTVFLGKGLPDKWAVYEAVKKDSTLSFYLPDTTLIQTAKDVLPLLFRERQCMLKPLKGSQGRGIIALTLSGKTIEAVYHSGVHKKTKPFPSLDEFESWMNLFLKQSPHAYLMQPLLSLSDRNRYPFDIRILMQKDGNGNWTERGRGIRRGYQGSFISNLGSGGEGNSYEDWFSKLSRRQAYLFHDDLSTILAKLPLVLEESFASLFELGIDIGYSRDGSIWILDVNSKPGRQLIMQTLPEQKNNLFEAPLAYCKHLISGNSLAGSDRPLPE